MKRYSAVILGLFFLICGCQKRIDAVNDAKATAKKNREPSSFAKDKNDTHRPVERRYSKAVSEIYKGAREHCVYLYRGPGIIVLPADEAIAAANNFASTATEDDYISLEKRLMKDSNGTNILAVSFLLMIDGSEKAEKIVNRIRARLDADKNWLSGSSPDREYVSRSFTPEVWKNDVKNNNFKDRGK